MTQSITARSTHGALRRLLLLAAVTFALGGLAALPDTAAYAQEAGDDPSVANDDGARVTKRAGERADADDANREGHLRKLVRDLGDPSFEIRERATLRLLGEGKDAISMLEEGMESKDDEVRARCSILLEEIRGPNDTRDGTDDRPPMSESEDDVRPDSERGRHSLRRELDTLRESMKRLRPRSFRWELGPDMRLHRGEHFREFERLMEDLEKELEDSGFDARHSENWSRIDEMFDSLEDGDFGAAGGTRGHAEIWRDGEKVFERNFEGEFAGQPQLGVWIESLHPALRAQLALGENEGVLITSVLDDTAAADAGLEQHDVVLAFNGTDTGDTSSLRKAVREAPTDKPVAVEIIRAGRRQIVNVQLEEPKSQKAK